MHGVVGDARVLDCLALLEERFSPDSVSTENVRRGRLAPQALAQRVAILEYHIQSRAEQAQPSRTV